LLGIIGLDQLNLKKLHFLDYSHVF